MDGQQQSSFTYDVFLSFCGSDIGHGFAGNLLKALHDSGLHTFSENGELPGRGEAINQSRFAIVVFSKNYAASSLCLEVLASIFDSFRGNRHLIFPVFYDVDRSDVGDPTGTYGQALATHEFENSAEKVETWRNALCHVANLSGWHFKHGGGYDEFELFGSIVEKICGLAPPPTGVAPVMSQISGVARVMSRISGEKMYRLLGIVSSVVGLSCHAGSHSFNRLIGMQKPIKLLYAMLSLVIYVIVLFAKPSSSSIKYKRYMCFVVFIIITVYSFFYDKAVDGKPETLSLVANAAFALVSLSLSKLVKFGFETGMFCYFLSCFTIQLLHIDWKLIWVAIIIDCPLFLWHFSSNSRPEFDYGEETIPLWTPN